MLRVLTYHRIGDPGDPKLLNPTLVSADPRQFQYQMEFLARKYRVVSAREVLDTLGSGEPLHPRSVMITFDDAYVDVADQAVPILERLGLPATLFVATSYPDNPARVFWWDRLYHALSRTSREDFEFAPFGRLPLGSPLGRQQTYRQLRNHLKRLGAVGCNAALESICRNLGSEPPGDNQVLPWSRLIELGRSGVTLGAHTETHPSLPQLPLEDAIGEVLNSQRVLGSRIGGTLPIFSYPDGGHTDQIVQVLEENNFRLAFTTLDGPNFVSRLPQLRLRRINITPRSSAALFRFRLTTAGTLVDLLRHR